MATPPDAVQAQLAVITTAAVSDLLAEVESVDPARRLAVMLDAIGLVVPTYYNAAGTLAAAWYDELRDEAGPRTLYTPSVIGDPTTDWIEREVNRFRADLDLALEEDVNRLVAEAAALAEKEAARGFRDTIVGNARIDEDAIGWSRVARPGACKFCLMLAGKGSVYRSESTAIFAAHKNCHCAARPEFVGGQFGPEADAIQYIASSNRARSDEAQDERNRKLRAYLNANFPDAPG